MLAFLAPLFLVLLAPATPLAAPPAVVEARLIQVAPVPPAEGKAAPPRRERAVVLIHGLAVHPLNKDKAGRAFLHTWQEKDSPLVHRLAQDSDVFSFAYAQTVPVEDIAAATDLAKRLRGLRDLGYREIVLIGHSAGGLIARHLVEDIAGTGVTKVIQVCPPNTGSSWASLRPVRSTQAAFLSSLSKTYRDRVLLRRADKRIPAVVQFAVVVGLWHLGGDGLVHARSQWPEDLQRQGIPAYAVQSAHRESVRTARSIDLLARLVREAQPRWAPEDVATVRRKLFEG